MMNDLLRDLVVEEKVAVFIDDVTIATETEEGHDEIVEEWEYSFYRTLI